VTPVELSDRKKVQECREQPDPGRQGDGMGLDDVARSEIPEEVSVGQVEKKAGR
jgi:hypothetical protein